MKEKETINEPQQPAFLQGAVLSSFSLRLLELIEQGYNTFNSGWNDAILELVYAHKIEIHKKGDGYTIVNKIAQNYKIGEQTIITKK